MQTIRFLNNAKFTNKPQIDLMLETDSSKEIRICMQKSNIMQEHTAPGAIVIMILSGSVRISSGDFVATFNAADAIYFDAKVPHSLEALEDSVIRLSLSKLDTVSRVKNLASR